MLWFLRTSLFVVLLSTLAVAVFPHVLGSLSNSAVLNAPVSAFSEDVEPLSAFSDVSDVDICSHRFVDVAVSSWTATRLSPGTVAHVRRVGGDGWVQTHVEFVSTGPGLFSDLSSLVPRTLQRGDVRVHVAWPEGGFPWDTGCDFGDVVEVWFETGNVVTYFARSVLWDALLDRSVGLGMRERENWGLWHDF